MIFPEIMLLFGLLQVFCLPPEGEDAPIQPKGKKARQPVPNGNNAPAPGLIRTLDRACRSRRGDDGGLWRGLPRGVWVPVLKANAAEDVDFTFTICHGESPYVKW